jgi:hypothetical protein
MPIAAYLSQAEIVLRSQALFQAEGAKDLCRANGL